MWNDINSIYNDKDYRSKRSLAISGKKNGMFGKKQTEMTKQLISKANKGKLSGSKNPRARRIQLISPYEKKFITYGNLTMFCEEYGLTPSAIVMICKGKRKMHKGWKAQYIDK